MGWREVAGKIGARRGRNGYVLNKGKKLRRRKERPGCKICGVGKKVGRRKVWDLGSLREATIGASTEVCRGGSIGPYIWNSVEIEGGDMERDRATNFGSVCRKKYDGRGAVI